MRTCSPVSSARRAASAGERSRKSAGWSVTLAVRFVPRLRRLPLRLLLPGFVRRRVEQELASASEYAGRGVRVILDKDGLAPQFLALRPPQRPASAPQAQEYVDAVNEFWFEAVWTAKHLRRGEVWRAKCVSLDGRMKSLLLRMMEWHAFAARGPANNTWEDGRFLEEWADPRAIRELTSAFAHYDADDIARALIATMDLFRWLAIETAQRLGCAYPAEAGANLTAWVKACLANKTERATSD